jgi:isoleucyl-tRNA synthetase
LGQKYGSKFPAIRKAILAVEPEAAALRLLDGKSISVEVDGETLEILPDEVEVRANARSGFEVASEGAYLAALVTELTPELVQEGLAREVVRRVQDLRKQADLDISDRIRLYYQATPALAEAIELHKEYLMGETLTVELLAAKAPQDLPSAEAEFGDEKITVAVEKAG